MKGNVIVGQSGGPTAAINSSLAGVYRTAKDRGANKVYGMLFGIQGLLQERYIDLSEYITNDLDTELLKRTPAAFLGSCRYKLPEIHENKDVYEKIFSILEKLDIEAFIYIGGNDSMDTIKKLSDYAIVTGLSLIHISPAPFPNELIILGEIRRNNCRKRCVLNQTHLISICILLEFIQKSKCLHYLFSFAFLPFSFVSFLRLHDPVKLFKSRCDHFIHIIVFIIPESSAENHVFLFVRQFFILFI